MLGLATLWLLKWADLTIPREHRARVIIRAKTADELIFRCRNILVEDGACDRVLFVTGQVTQNVYRFFDFVGHEHSLPHAPFCVRKRIGAVHGF